MTYSKEYSCFSELFWGYAFFHFGSNLYCALPGTTMTPTVVADLSSVAFAGSGYTPKRGTWLRYGEDLYYKAPGVFVKIVYTPGTPPTFNASNVATNPYTPITYINASWENGSGDSYQPENRLSAKKTIWYNAGTEEKVQKFSGTGSQASFTITLPGFAYITDVTVDGMSVGNWDVSGTTLTFYTSPNTWNITNGDMHLVSAPPAGTNNVVVTCQCAVKTYYLPVKNESTTIEEIKVFSNGSWSTLIENTDFNFVPTTGLITFTTAPEVTQPLSSNTVRVTYSLSNPDAFNSIMDCPYAIVYGGNQNICMVVGGCTAQPNAFFWNGNNVAMDVSYWPMEQYNLGGDTEDEITGFGRQQGHLVVFKSRSVGKVSMELTTLGDTQNTTARVYIEMDYTQINSRIGCDLPWTIQLIDNNLVFCNSSQGVHYVKDSSAALLIVAVQISLCQTRVRLTDVLALWMVLDETLVGGDGTRKVILRMVGHREVKFCIIFVT